MATKPLHERLRERLTDRLKKLVPEQRPQRQQPPAGAVPPSGVPTPEPPAEPSEVVAPGPTDWGKQPRPKPQLAVPDWAKHPEHGHLMFNVGDPVEFDAGGGEWVDAVHVSGPPKRLTREEIDQGMLPYRGLPAGAVRVRNAAQGTVASLGQNTLVVRVAPKDVSITEGALSPREERLLKQVMERQGGWTFGFNRPNLVPLRLENERVWADAPRSAQLREFRLPEDHQPAMVVPKGGSCCANCRFLEGETCLEPNYINWNGSGDIPAPLDEYCSDFYQPKHEASTSGPVRSPGVGGGDGRRPVVEAP